MIPAVTMNTSSFEFWDMETFNHFFWRAVSVPAMLGPLPVRGGEIHHVDGSTSINHPVLWWQAVSSTRPSLFFLSQDSALCLWLALFHILICSAALFFRNEIKI